MKTFILASFAFIIFSPEYLSKKTFDDLKSTSFETFGTYYVNIGNGLRLFCEPISNVVVEGEMKEGISHYIYYQTWGGAPWRASLEDISFNAHINNKLVNVTDPDFRHHG